jgi:lysozyme
MSFVDTIAGLFNAPAPTPAVVAARAAIPIPTPAVGELELTQSVVQQIIEPGEGCVLHSYPDPGTGGDPITCCYGHTGPSIAMGQVFTQAQCDMFLRVDLAKFLNGVRVVASTGTLLTQEQRDNQFSAMVSLAYNIGFGAFRGSSVLRYHNEGNFPAAADAFLLWDKSAGNVMPGLVHRRHQERELYLGQAIEA